MSRYIVSKTVIEDWEAVIEADSQDEVMDIIADGDVEWEFVQSDEQYEVEDNG